MPLTKPYHRIWRPMANRPRYGEDKREKYLTDEAYVNKLELQSLLSATRLILLDLHDLFNYIEPCKDNFYVYSHRIYELFLRTATEFEANCKAILLANHYAFSRAGGNITDYTKINKAAKLDQYKVKFSFWLGEPNIWTPFEALARDENLLWYQSYNKVKHNRFINFKEANLGNLVNAVAGLVSILAAQNPRIVSNVTYDQMQFVFDDSDIICNSLFELQLPTFPEDEQYDFNWEQVKTQPNSVVDFMFD